MAYGACTKWRDHERVAVVMAEIDSADLKAHTVTATTGEVYHGDVLVLAAGAEANFFGIPGSEQFLVVGGGATGVETAGAISDVVRRIPKKFFPNVDFDTVVISLVDAGDSVLAPFTQNISGLRSGHS